MGLLIKHFSFYPPVPVAKALWQTGVFIFHDNMLILKIRNPFQGFNPFLRSYALSASTPVSSGPTDSVNKNPACAPQNKQRVQMRERM